MHPIEEALYDSVEALPQRVQFVVGWCAIEHLMDLYWAGKSRARADAEQSQVLGVPAGTDLVEHGQALLWRAATNGAQDRNAIAAIVRALNSVQEQARGDKLAKPGIGVTYGLGDLLLALNGDDEVPEGLTRAVSAVFHLFALFSDDEDAPAREKRRENEWQTKVARLLLKHGDKPIDRSLFDPLLREELPWRAYLTQYAERCSLSDSPDLSDAPQAAKKNPAPANKNVVKKSKPAKKSAKKARPVAKRASKKVVKKSKAPKKAAKTAKRTVKRR
jgi:hypothetical protein